MGQISGQNYVIRLFYEFLVRGRKCSKTTITREEKRMGANPFRILLVSPGPTYAQNMSLIGESHLGTFSSVDQCLCLFILHFWWATLSHGNHHRRVFEIFFFFKNLRQYRVNGWRKCIRSRDEQSRGLSIPVPWFRENVYLARICEVIVRECMRETVFVNVKD